MVVWSKHKNSGKILSFLHRKECIIALETGETDKSYSSILDLRKKHRKSVKKWLVWGSNSIDFTWIKLFLEIRGSFMVIFLEFSQNLQNLCKLCKNKLYLKYFDTEFLQINLKLWFWNQTSSFTTLCCVATLSTSSQNNSVWTKLSSQNNNNKRLWLFWRKI